MSKVRPQQLLVQILRLLDLLLADLQEHVH